MNVGPLVLGTVGVVSIAVLVAVSWQHLRYLGKRREAVQDRQPLWHGASTFHVITLAELAAGAELLAESRRLVGALEAAAGARVVYAGKRVMMGRHSSQLPQREWDFAVVSQYASREAYEKARTLPAVVAAHAAFDATHDQGMQRSAAFNLALPVLLLARRAADIATRRPARYPFERAELALDDPLYRERTQRVEELRKETEFGREAVLVVNYLLGGTPEQKSQNRAYGMEMMGLMAEQGHGPMHMGRAVTVEGNAHFESVALVYYPGTEYFAQMVESSFFGGIIGGKQLGDTLSMVTAPLLDRL